MTLILLTLILLKRWARTRASVPALLSDYVNKRCAVRTYSPIRTVKGVLGITQTRVRKAEQWLYFYSVLGLKSTQKARKSASLRLKARLRMYLPLVSTSFTALQTMPDNTNAQ